jgi:hypothetical protein
VSAHNSDPSRDTKIFTCFWAHHIHRCINKETTTRLQLYNAQKKVTHIKRDNYELMIFDYVRNLSNVTVMQRVRVCVRIVALTLYIGLSHSCESEVPSKYRLGE